MTLVWTMGRWRVVQANDGFLIQKLNVFGAVVKTRGPYTGWQSQKIAIREARRLYAEDE